MSGKDIKYPENLSNIIYTALLWVNNMTELDADNLNRIELALKTIIGEHTVQEYQDGHLPTDSVLNLTDLTSYALANKNSIASVGEKAESNSNVIAEHTNTLSVMGGNISTIQSEVNSIKSTLQNIIKNTLKSIKTNENSGIDLDLDETIPSLYIGMDDDLTYVLDGGGAPIG